MPNTPISLLNLPIAMIITLGIYYIGYAALTYKRKPKKFASPLSYRSKAKVIKFDKEVKKLIKEKEMSN